MTFILDFMIKYRSNDDKWTSEMCVLATKSYKNHKFSSPEPPQIHKKDSIYILIAILFFCSYEGGCHGHSGFFHLNVLISNVYVWSTKLLQLLQLNHLIINISSGILIVTVNTWKWRTSCFKGQIKVTSFHDTRKYFSIITILQNSKLCFRVL